MLKVIAVVILLIEVASSSVLIISVISDICNAWDIRRMIEELKAQEKNDSERDADEE